MYSHTQNENGTYNTRCLDCFMTIASSVETDEELVQLEDRHLCLERVLSSLIKKGVTAEEHHGRKVA